jgi:hypothetical protein
MRTEGPSGALGLIIAFLCSTETSHLDCRAPALLEKTALSIVRTPSSTTLRPSGQGLIARERLMADSGANSSAYAGITRAGVNHVKATPRARGRLGILSTSGGPVRQKRRPQRAAWLSFPRSLRAVRAAKDGGTILKTNSGTRQIIDRARSGHSSSGHSGAWNRKNRRRTSGGALPPDNCCNPSTMGCNSNFQTMV